MFYVDARQASANLWRVPLDGGPAKPVTNFKNEQIWSFDLLRDGKQFVIARGTAKQKKNYAEADRIRNDLLSAGIVLEDGPKGTSWRVG